MKIKIFISFTTFIIFLFLGLNPSLEAQVLEQDSLALVALYNSTDGANWTNNENWLNGKVSTWKGINVVNNRVTTIYMYRNNLTGTIPPEIGNLTELSILQFGENEISGTIPEEIGNLTNLITLYLFINQLEGEIPKTIGNLTNLEQFAIDDNNLIGEIPSEIGNLTKLVRIQLYRNNLSGTLPKSIGNLTNLVKLILWENQLTGEIPEEISGMSNLKELLLYDNQFTGSIPTTIGMLDSLEHLNLYKNLLEGDIPLELANLEKLNKLVLAENNFEGALPSEITTLPNLKELYLQTNKLSKLPDLSPLDSLQKLRIQENNFTFEDIEPNMWIPTFTYSPQDSVGLRIDTMLALGESLTLSVEVGGSANTYQWTKDGTDIPDATESSYRIDTAQTENTGIYICKINNTIATELTLYSREINVFVGNPVYVKNSENEMLRKFELSQNFPNPFNPTTIIKYSIPVGTAHELSLRNVNLTVYDILGRKVAVLVNQKQKPGDHEVFFQSEGLSSGIYFYELRSGEFRDIKKMILLR